MNIKILVRFAILIIFIASVGCSGIKAQDKSAQIPPAVQAKTQKNILPPQVKPTQVTAPKAEPPSVKPLAKKVDRYAIGCVLPLSGSYKLEGNKALEAVLLSAGIFDASSKTPWKVIAADSRGVAEGVKEAIALLANEENVMAIIAVVGTTEASEAALAAEKFKVPILLVTSKEGITTGNEYVFQHFLTPTQQIRALAKYALDNLNCAIFSVLYPRDRYGMEMVKIFREEVQNIGGKVEMAVPYNKTQTDFAAEINKVTGNRLNTGDELSPKKKTETTTQLSTGFEALFIPDSYPRVKMIAEQLAFYNVSGFYLVGTSLMNSPELLKKSSEHLEGAIIADSFNNVSYYPETNNFIDIYYSAYDREPGHIEALAYDSAGMIFQVLENTNVQTRHDFVSALTRLKNYAGATGATSFDEDRVSQKIAFILKVRNGKLEQVK